MKKTCTLEEHLHRLAEGNDEVKGLESVFTLQKKKLNRYLSSVSTTFPTYSSHDTEHSRSIIASIEMILGKKYVKKLSGVDTFLILTCAYMHDVGMLYSDEEVRELWASAEFQEYLKECTNRCGEVEKAASMVCNGFSDEWRDTPLWPLELRRSITILLMDYYRPLHGMRIEKNTDRTIKGIPELLSLDESFIPRRLNEVIRRISKAHTAEFKSLLVDLPHEDSYGREFFHPRMIAFLLRLGDLCDLDNNRFNKVSIATFGTLGDESLAHYFKHTSVSTLYLSHEMIKIVADISKTNIFDECRRGWLRDEKDGKKLSSRVDLIFQNTVREHIRWRSMMERELRDAKLNGKEIFPVGWKFLAPELEYEIRINGEKVVAEDANLRFLFPQERAFQLIEGISIYGEEKFIFVRELLQNAIDASKMQLWRDVQATYSGRKTISPFEMHRNDNNLFDRYRIDIKIDLNENKTLAHFEIGDHGIGINRRELKENILTTGQSWSKREEYKKEMENMPDWLRPTGSFGIGLHTVFYVTDCVLILSKSDTESFTNRITLNSGKKEGYAFCENNIEPRHRGSTFELDIDLTDDVIRDELGYGSGDDFLKEVENDLERKLVKMLESYCDMSLFPVYVNNKRILLGLTETQEFNCLGMDAPDDSLAVAVEDERFYWAFNSTYESVELWDRKHSLAINFEIEKDDASCICPQYVLRTYFKGMQLQCGVELPQQAGCLRIQCLDIEWGESSEVLNAGRSEICREAEKNVLIWLEECIVFVEQRYFDLMVTVQESKSVKDLEIEVATSSIKYMKKQLNVSEIWEAACRIRGKILPIKQNLASEEKKDLEFASRVTTHMIHCTILDRIFYQFVHDVVNMNFKSLEDWLKKVPVYPFAVLDDLIRRWKCDRRMEWEYGRNAFNEQLLDLFGHYLVIFSMTAVECSYREKIHMGRQECAQFEKSADKFLKNNMPFLSKWKESEKRFIIFKQIFDYYCGYRSYIMDYTTEEICNHLLKPASAFVFDEWCYKGAYAEDDAIPLKFTAPYMSMLFLCLLSKDDRNPQKERLWKSIIRKTIYSNFSYGLENLDCMTDMLDAERIVVCYGKEGEKNQLLPFLPAMNLTMVKLRPESKKNGYTKPASQIIGVEADEESIRLAFLQCLKHMDMTAMRGADVLEFMCGFSKYSSIVIRSNEYSSDLYTGVTSRHWQIPLWDYNTEILNVLGRFSDRWDTENFIRCRNEIIQSGSLNRVVEYISRVKREEYSHIEVEKIRQQYEEFVNDFLIVWWKEDPIAYG